jgi:LytR cell envelope-related transcriptional attenuator
MRLRPGDRERGVALPPWAIGVSIGVVVLALLAFAVTGSPDRGDEAAADTGSSATGSSTEPSSQPSQPAPDAKPTKPPTSPPGTKRPPEPNRHDRGAYVEIYNNSGISGLANETAARLQDTGWKVVGADNWYGDIPASTVYYPERLRAAAKLLAADLGIGRLHTAVPPMRFDRLTVILTGPL